jgi:hypothetical protein
MNDPAKKPALSVMGVRVLQNRRPNEMSALLPLAVKGRFRPAEPGE